MISLYLFNKKTPALKYGVGSYINQLCTAFRDHKEVQLHVINEFASKEKVEIEKDSNITYISLPTPKRYTHLEKNMAIYSCNSLYLLYKYIDVAKKKIFILNFIYDETFLSFIRRNWKDSLIVYVTHFFDYKITVEEKNRIFFSKVDKIVCLSIDTYQYYNRNLSIPEENLCHIPNALVEDGSVSDISKADLKRKMNFQPEDKIILFAGRVDMFKGIGYLPHMIHYLIKRDPAFKLIIAGDGCLEDYIPQFIKSFPKVIFVGKIPPEKLVDYYLVADVGIIPSWHEQCSFVAIEMLKYGLPTVVSDVTGLSEMFIEGYDTFRKISISTKYKNRDQESELFANAVLDAFKNPEEMKNIGLRAKHTFMTKYTLTQLMEKYQNQIFKMI